MAQQRSKYCRVGRLDDERHAKGRLTQGSTFAVLLCRTSHRQHAGSLASAMRITSMSLLSSRRRARKQKKKSVERRVLLQSLVLVPVIECTQPDSSKYTDQWPTEITKVSAKHFRRIRFRDQATPVRSTETRKNWSADRET